MKEAIPSPYSAGSAEPRVSSLELFFDLAIPTALIGLALTPLAEVAALAVILIGGAFVDNAVTNRRSVR